MIGASYRLKIIAGMMIALTAVSTLWGRGVAWAADNPQPATVSCEVTQNGKNVKSDPEAFINPPQADPKGGNLTWKVVIKYSEKYVKSYSNNSPVFANNFQSFTWTGNIDGKTIDMKAFSNNPYGTNAVKTTSGLFTYSTETYSLFGDYYNIANPQHKNIYTKVTLKTVDKGTQTIDCDVVYKPIESPTITFITPIYTPTTTQTNTNTANPVGVSPIGTFPVDYSKSSFTASPANVTGNGTNKSTLTAKIVNTLGNPVAGQTVTIIKTSTNSGVPVFLTNPMQTNNEGIATFEVSANYVGEDTFAATVGTPAIAINQKAIVNFTASANASLPTNNSNSSSSSSSPSSTSSSSNFGSDNGMDSDSTGSGNTASGNNIALAVSPDILSCKARSKVVYFENDEPAFDWAGVDCVLSKDAQLEAGIYSKSFDVKNTDNSANLIKTLRLPKKQSAGKFYLGWNGYDEYDQAAELDEYVFVIKATLAGGYMPDTSIQKFKIQNPEVVVTKTENLRGSAEENARSENILENIAGTILGGKVSEGQASPEITSVEGGNATNQREASKCPNVFYPTDIEASALKDLIKQAYDECLVRGYADGTFRPKQGLTRAEATKIVLLASGKVAKQGCFDADCGSPFTDLDMWQGPWIRAAWDLRIVSGVGMGLFAPNKEITRGEAAALVVKAFGIVPHSGCYDADCGAGHPDNEFEDIRLMWQGPYLRVLWDKGLIQSLTPRKFFPDISITREQFLELALKARG